MYVIAIHDSMPNIDTWTVHHHTKQTRQNKVTSLLLLVHLYFKCCHISLEPRLLCTTTLCACHTQQEFIIIIF